MHGCVGRRDRARPPDIRVRASSTECSTFPPVAADRPLRQQQPHRRAARARGVRVPRVRASAPNALQPRRLDAGDGPVRWRARLPRCPGVRAWASPSASAFSPLSYRANADRHGGSRRTAVLRSAALVGWSRVGMLALGADQLIGRFNATASPRTCASGCGVTAARPRGPSGRHRARRLRPHLPDLPFASRCRPPFGSRSSKTNPFSIWSTADGFCSRHRVFFLCRLPGRAAAPRR